MKLDGYVRVSRVAGRGGDTFISPTVQRERLEAWCHAHGHELARVNEELDVSGAATVRPAFEQALARVEAGDTDGVIVAKLDRFARSQRQALDALDRIEQAGGVLVSVEDSFDTSTPIGRAMRSIILVFAELERERTRESWATAQERAVARGVHIASRTPTGYRRRPDGRLDPDPAAAGAVREVFLRRAAGASWSELARLLEARGVVGPYANAVWTTSAVSKVVRNRVYLGEARSGQHVNADAHEPIVSRAEWEAAQASSGVTARGKGGALLSGILRCASCRYALKADTMRGRAGERIALYRCRGRHAAGVCPAPASALARVIDPFIEARFLAALGPDGALAEAAAQTGEPEELTAAVEDAELELAAYRDEGRIADVIGRDAFLAGLEERARRLDEARRELADAHERAHLGSSLPTLPGRLADAWPALTVAERRAILAAAIPVVFLRPGRNIGIEERALALWRGQEPAGLPRRGHRVPLEPFVWPDDAPCEAGLAVA
jgi:DNA invertase Pin-like site-specific DNA recombinase